MKQLQRRLTNLETVLLDPVRLVPHSRMWIEHWDRQYYLFLSGQDRNAVRQSTVEAFRAVMNYADNPASLVGRIPHTDE